jgi:thiol-disulfide isomerase/thioredoxin
MMTLAFVKMNAQLVSGTKFPENIKTTDIKGNEFDLFKELEAGKSVIIDVFATWCGPCWGFHQSHYLENLYQELGPTGTNQIRVVAIEADSRTPLDHIYMQVTGTSTVPSSLGNWTEGISYPLINSADYNTMMKIEFFPTLYIIRPDRTVMEIGDFRGNDAVWRKALLPQGEKDVIFTGTLDDKTFCSTTVFAQKPTIINMGTTEINTVDVDLKINDNSKPAKLTKKIGVFETGDIPFSNTTINTSSDIVVSIDAVDGVADITDNSSVLSATYLKPVLKKKGIIVKFVTDFYPGELSWKLRDNKNRTLLTQFYNPGPLAEGGGGDDANKEFVYEVPIENVDINCLTLVVTDSYGDGAPYFGENDPVPGVSFLDSDNTEIKPYFPSDLQFTTSKSIFSSVDFTSDLEDAEFVESLNVFPNPVSDLLTIDMKIKSGTDYSVFITDLMGKTIANLPYNSTYLDVSTFNSGVYFINVKTTNGVYAHKFTKI